MLNLGKATYIPQSVGVALPMLSTAAAGFYAGASAALRAPFILNGTISPMLLMRLPTYIPTVTVTSEHHRNAAAPLTYSNPHRMWLLQTDLPLSVPRAADAMRAWQQQAAPRVIAAPGIDLNPSNLGWTERLLDAWGEAPNFFWFDLDMDSYDDPHGWLRDIDHLQNWLRRGQGVQQALLTVTLPNRKRITYCIDRMWGLVRDTLEILAVAVRANPADSFLDNNLWLTPTGKIYLDRSMQSAQLRTDGQTASEAGSLP
jgi:hypothetical protein